MKEYVILTEFMSLLFEMKIVGNFEYLEMRGSIEKM